MELSVLFAVLAAAVWGIYLITRVSLPAMACLVLIIGTVFGPNFFMVDGPVQISIDRVLWVLMLGLFGIAWLFTNKTHNIRLTRLDGLLIAFVGYLLVSTQLGEIPAERNAAVGRWLFYILMPTGMYFVVRYWKLVPRDLQFINTALIGLGIYLALTAVAELTGATALVFPRYIADPSLAEFFGRGRGPLLNPSGNGILLVITTCIVATGLGRASRPGQCAFAAILCISIVGIYATLTRSVWMSVVLALAIIGGHRIRPAIRVWWVSLAMAVAIAAAYGLGDELLYLKRDKNLSPQASVESIELRPLLAVIALEMFLDRPVTGVGYGHYFSYNEQYARSANTFDLPVRKAIPYMQHNVFLSYLVDSGLIGACMFTFLFVGWFLQALRIANKSTAHPQVRQVGLVMIACLTSYFVNGMFQDVSVIPMVNMYLFFFAGLTGSIEARESSMHPAAPSGSPLPTATSTHTVQTQMPAKC